MAKVYTYIPPMNSGQANVDTNNLATKTELREGIKEAKDYTDSTINNINLDGGSNHVHANKSLLDKFTESNGDLFFNGMNVSGILFEDVEG